mgnify:CR=1 FL=1
MEFSIIIPTFQNFNYLIMTVESIIKNSFYKHQIIVHNNGNDEKTFEYLNKNKIEYTSSKSNIGLCKGVNMASKLSKTEFIVYAHDDMYFLPSWDKYLKKEIDVLKDKKFYLSATQIGSSGPAPNSIINHIRFDCGDKIENFDEQKLINNFKKLDFYDLQGSHWAPHIIHRDLWNKVGGFSEEFYPGTGSDPDLNMKLWKCGVRIFKGLNECKVYHFGSIVTRKYKNHPTIKTESGNKGSKIFLLKWGISIKFFKKYYLNSDNPYDGELNEPRKNLIFYIGFLKCKFNYIYQLFISKLKWKN